MPTPSQNGIPLVVDLRFPAAIHKVHMYTSHVTFCVPDSPLLRERNNSIAEAGNGCLPRCVRLAVSVRQLAHPSFEKAPLRLLLSETEGPFVRGSRLCCSPGSAAEIGPRGVREMIVRQIPSC